MQYDEALREWGARRLSGYAKKGETIDQTTVSVVSGYDDGGGCESCSYTTAGIEVEGKVKGGKRARSVSTIVTDFNYGSMADFLAEIVAVAEELEKDN